jgi:hypothetical protein
VGQDKQPVPYRMMWYQTSPYFAYYWTGRYQDLINLVNTNLDPSRLKPPRSLEESWYWKARAEYALGSTTRRMQTCARRCIITPASRPRWTCSAHGE